MMKIEILPHPDRKRLLTISFDGDPWRHIHSSIFGFRPALPKECSSLEQFTEVFTAIEYRLARQYIIKRLSFMSLPSAKLIKSLKERLISDTTISRVINELSAGGYINDEEWVASFVRVQSQRKLGPRAIAQKLAGKGMSSARTAIMLQETQTEEIQCTNIKKLLMTRYRSRDLSDYREKKKVVASLLRRGFDLSLILSTLGDANDFGVLYEQDAFCDE